MANTPLRYHDTYTGPRFTYGLTYRPLAYANQPEDFIVFSWRPDPRGKFAHGLVDYPRELTADEVAGYQLALVSLTVTARSPRGRWVSPSQPGDWWTDAEMENGYAPQDAYFVDDEEA